MTHIDIKKYASEVQHNAQIMGSRLLDNGIYTYSKDYKTHILLVDVTPYKLTGNTAEQIFYENHLLVNKNQIPFDTLPPQITSGIRFGTTCISNLNYSNNDIIYLADCISNLLLHQNIDKEVLEYLINKDHKNTNISN